MYFRTNPYYIIDLYLKECVIASYYTCCEIQVNHELGFPVYTFIDGDIPDYLYVLPCHFYELNSYEA